MGDRNDGRYGYNGDSNSRGAQVDDPPNSRLFIVANKRLNESDFREAFNKFGEIEDLWVVKDRRTGENKGVTYIKYSKTSEAANALEEMNGKTLAGTDRYIKVMIASSRNKGSQREENEDEKTNRLFVLCSKTMTETELQTQFEKYGDIDYVNIVRDKETRESKGFAYIKYYKFSHAAKAFEECDRKFKAVFSEPRKPNMGSRQNNEYQMEPQRNMGRNPGMSMGTPFNDAISNSDKCYRLMIVGSPSLTEDQLWKLCNIIPGLEFCQLKFETNKRRTFGMAIYSTMQWATYACDKLHGFEYPTGSRLIVKPDGTVPRIDSGNRPQSRMNADVASMQQLYDTVAHATSMIQNAVFSSPVPNNSQNSNDASEACSIELPDPQPLASVDLECVARCFIVCTPPPPPPALLRDLFCRFGNLIEVYMLAHKNCGYAKFATKESAQNAIKTLHGIVFCGGRMKVLEAEERGDHKRKRMKVDD